MKMGATKWLVSLNDFGNPINFIGLWKSHQNEHEKKCGTPFGF